MCHAARQSLYVESTHIEHVVRAEFLRNFATWNQLVVYVEFALTHLNAVARKPNNPFDEVGRVVCRHLEDGDVAAIRGMRENSAREQRHPERQRIAAVSVSKFRYKQIISH